MLQNFHRDISNINKLFYFMKTSGDKYVLFLSCSAIKQLIEERWNQVPFNLKIQMG